MTAARRGGPGKGFFIALGAIVVIGISALAYQANKPRAVTKVDPNLPAMKAQGYTMGNPAAPVEVVEFADFECPGCGQFATLTEPDVRTRLINTGQVKIRFLDFPLDMHKNTWDASLAASCANDQGKFWQMHDAIFANQDKWNGEATSRPRGPLGEIAKMIGLDMSKYNACMDAEPHRAQIQANQAEGLRRQVQQTPTFMIGDQMVPGSISYDQFKKMVDDAASRVKPVADPGSGVQSDTKPATAAAPAQKAK